MHKLFTAFATRTAHLVGTPWAFLIALTIVIVWAVTGPMFNYSDTWQLVINTGTTIITFLMVFLIQNTQNRDAKAMQLKLDELISSIKEAHNEMIDIEELSDEKLEEIAEHYRNKRKEQSAEMESIANDAAQKAADRTSDRVKEQAEGIASDTAREVAEDTAKKVA